jgi:LacI family transcriptional regulator
MSRKATRAGNGKPTIMDVARLAEVSIKTVSRVINKEPNVREELRERVRRAATMLGYRPNLSARSLAGVRSFLIGYLFGDPGGDYTHRVEVSLLNRCRQAGYYLMVEQIDAAACDVTERTSALVSQLRLDGVILTAPITDDRDVLRVLDEARVPYVRIAPDNDSDRSPQVRIDDFRAAQELTEHLIALGHRQIGFIKGDPRHAAARLRFDGFRSGMQAHGLEVPETLVEQGSFSYSSGLECAGRMLQRPSRPTAIVASNDDMAAAAIAVALTHTIKVPDQLSVVGFDDAPIAEVVWPPLTTVRQPVGQMAEVAADLLLSVVVGKNSLAWPDPMPRRQLDYELVLRQSTGPVAGSPRLNHAAPGQP